MEGREGRGGKGWGRMEGGGLVRMEGVRDVS